MRNHSVSNHISSNTANNSNINMNSGPINGGNGMIARAFPLRILVHSDVVGAIIGRSGSTIKNITQQTKARIDVHRDESPEHQEKVITINGAPENCSEACFKILEVVQNEMNAKFDAPNDPERDTTLKILASSNLIGRLIGKSGSTIKKIMEQTSTRINISTNGITESTGEHTIVVVGKLEHIRQAERLISTKLRAAYMSDMNTSLHTMSQQQYLFNNVLLPYMPSPYSQNSILASIANPQANHSGNSMTRAMPLPHQGQMPSSMYNTGAPSYLPLYQTANVPPTGPGLMGFNPVAPGFEQEKETTYIYIPSIMVGAIIGKSGAAIKEMISTSGASIKVETASTLPEPQLSEKSQEDNVKLPETELDEANTDGQSPNGANPEKSATFASTSSPKVSRYQSGLNDPQSTRKVTIMGYSASQYSAQYMIYRKISVESGKSDTSLMVEIYVPSQFVGKIIGKGGSTVKLLQKQTRTTIRLPEDKPSQTQSSPTGSGETCVQITGEFEGSQAAQRHIKSMIRESLLYVRQMKSQHHKNNESNTVKNNAQNNIQSSDNGNVSTHFATEDKSSTLVGTSNEKGIDKSVQGNDRHPLQRESPSLSCNSDDQTTKQEEKSHNNSQQIISTGIDDERNHGEQDVISNNNTIINNLNSSKQSVRDMKLRDYTADGLRKSDGDSKEGHIENGESVHLQSAATS